MSAELDGRTVLVTGAGAGLGRAIAIAAGDAGARVVVTSLSENGLETTRTIEDRGGEARWVTCDVTRRDSVSQAVDSALEWTGQLDGVVHNALSRPLTGRSGALPDVDLEVWEHQARVSLRGAFYCAQEAYPHLVAARGRLVLLTSGAGIEGSPTGVYGTHKSAIRGLTKSLAREWGPLGVTVNCISPLVITPAVERAFEATTDLEDRMSRMAALHRLGDALEDAGGPFVFLLSDASHFVTGQTLVVDGGRCLQL